MSRTPLQPAKTRDDPPVGTVAAAVRHPLVGADPALHGRGDGKRGGPGTRRRDAGNGDRVWRGPGTAGLILALALLIAVLVILPVLSVVWIALHPEGNVWPHLLATSLPRYLSNTLVLMLGAGSIAAVTGTVTAWLVVMYRFPGSRWLEWLLLAPLAVPAYVGAYALVDFLDYSGPVQTGLRLAMGWQDARDYAFPAIRSRGAASVVLAASLYPYVYLLARAAFREQSAAGHDVARALGAGPLARFWRIGLPLARPAIAAGTAIVMMETVADFGVTDYFAVQTMTTGIFSVWLQGGDRGAAAQIACAVLVLVLVLIGLERAGRRGMGFAQSPRGMRALVAEPLTGLAGLAACLFCALPVAAGFGLPVAVMAGHALANPDGWVAPGLGRALANTLITCGAAAILTVGAAVCLVAGARLPGGGPRFSPASDRMPRPAPNPAPVPAPNPVPVPVPVPARGQPPDVAAIAAGSASGDAATRPGARVLPVAHLPQASGPRAGLPLASGIGLQRVRSAPSWRAARHLLPWLLPLTTIGYAAPGAVLAIGLLFPLAALDNRLADLRETLTGVPQGLLLTGTAAALIYAYAVRFFAVAEGAVEAAFGRIPQSLGMAARSLGRGEGGTLGRVVLPLIRGSVGTALLLVFVDCMKELPATLLLRPFNFDTLATRVHEKASLENLGDASPAALLVIATGLLAVALLARASR